MTAKRLKVIVTRRLPDPVEIRLKELFDTELNETDVNVFSTGLSSKEETELEQFRQDDLSYANEPTEDYYRKL